MDNKYYYYTTDGNDQNEQNRTGSYGYESYQAKQPKPRKKAPRWLKTAGLALMFGVIASVAFQTGNFVAGKLSKTTSASADGKSSSDKESNDGQIGKTQLTQASGSETLTDVTEVADNVMPSIVAITNMSVTQVQNFFGGVQEQESESAGSGIIIAENADELLILTNNHVVEGCDQLTVTFVDNESVEANIKGTDSSRDLAVIAVDLGDIADSTRGKISVAQMGDSTALKVGEPAIAIGNALGYGQSVTTGIISATNRTVEGYEGELIQTDAAINPGNSGGALLNQNGEVIGINSIKVAVSEVEGMGYAIPISDASEIITDLMNQETKKKVAEDEQGYLGIQGVDVDEDSAQMYGMPVGVYISDVIKGGGCAKAGVTKGSIITALEGTTVTSMSALKEQLEYYAAGETVTVTLQVPANNGEYKEQSVKVTLGKNK